MGAEKRLPVSVGSLMKGPVVTTGSETTLRDAARDLRRAEAGTLVVMEGSAIAGILSERDVVRALAEDANPDEVWVGDVMSEEPRYLTVGDEVGSALEIMLAAGIRHLPVVDEAELVGIVSIRDLSKALLPP
jgi:CBS domain-containing protein